MKQGPSTMFSTLPSHSTRIAIAASPDPRNTAFSRNSRTIVTLPPSITRVNPLPDSITAGDAPINANSVGAHGAAANAIVPAMMTPSSSDWPAARAAPSGSCSPVRRATIAVAPIESPIATV